MGNLRKVAVLQRLLDGHYPQRIARDLGLSRMMVWRLTRELEHEGAIQRTSKYPALYGRPAAPKGALGNLSQGTVEGGKSTSQTGGGSPFFPHRVGLSFRLERRPERWRGGVEWRVSSWRARRWFDGAFTVVAYPRRVHVWGHVPVGRSVWERLRLSYAGIARRAAVFAGEQGCVLVAEKKLLPEEWVAANREISDRLEVVLGLRAGPRVLGKVKWVMDASHSPFAEITQAAGERPELTTEMAERFEWLLLNALELRDGLKGLGLLSDWAKGVQEALSGLGKQVKDSRGGELGTTLPKDKPKELYH